MYIKSKFKDYYDSGSAYGVDKKKVFNRHQKEFKISKHFDSKKEIDDSWNLFNTFYLKRRYSFSKGGLFVCGKIYPLIVISEIEKTPQEKELSKDYYIFSEKDIALYQPIILEETNGKLDILNIKTLFGESGKILTTLQETKEILSRQKMISFLNEISKETESAYFLFSFSSSYQNKQEVNFNVFSHPNLKDLGFSKIQDPLTLYGQIEQYISNVFHSGEPDMIEISDKDKAVSHGHDGKYSFKKPPEK